MYLINSLYGSNTTNCKPKTVSSVAKEYVQKPGGFKKLILQPSLKVLSATELALGCLSTPAKTTQWAFGRTEKGIDIWSDFSSDAVDMVDSMRELRNTYMTGVYGELPEKVKKVYVNTMFAVGNVRSIVKIGHEEKLITLTCMQLQFLKALGVLGSVAFFISSVDGLKKQVRILKSSEFKAPEFKLAMVRTCGKICLLALATFSLITFAVGSIIPAVIYLMISTLFLITSLFAHFYEEIQIKKCEKTVAK